MYYFFISNQGNAILHHGEDDAETRELNREPVQIDFVLNDLNLSYFEALEPKLKWTAPFIISSEHKLNWKVTPYTNVIW